MPPLSISYVPQAVSLLALVAARAGGPRSVLIAGGGSGGHVFPAMAVGEELSKRGWKVAFVGRATGMEARLAAAHGYTFHALRSRPLVGRGPLSRLMAFVLLGFSLFRAVALVRKVRPSAVLGTGGYVSAPAVVGAFLCRRPTCLLEPNAKAGVANRWLSRLSVAAITAHETTSEGLRCPATNLGVPVRAAFFEQSPPASVAGPAAASRVRVLVLGGSQGARTLNQELPQLLLGALSETGGVVLHQCGSAHLESTLECYRRLLPHASYAEETLTAKSFEVRVTPFIDDVAGAMGESELVISRAGAITLAEICAVGRASVLVPLPLAGGHQRDNANALAAAGAAIVLEQSRLPEAGSRLAEVLEDTAGLRDMGERARSLAHPTSAIDIAAKLEELALPAEVAA